MALRPARAGHVRHATALLLVGLLAACGTTSSGAGGTTVARQPPDLRDFLKLPPASPQSCPKGTDSSTVGRVSPWSGTIDVSVFLDSTDQPATIRSIGRMLRRQPLVATTYFESARQARAEFARLYTCSATVPLSETPASYRLVLHQHTTVAARDGLVSQLLAAPGVETISCDPTVPCTDVVRSAQPSSR